MSELKPADRKELLGTIQRQYESLLDTFPVELRPSMIRSYGSEDFNSPGLLSLVALPFWVGNRLRVPDEICREMAVGNLFLLHSFQSYDFVVDGDRPGTSIRSQIVLGNLCHLQVMNHYRPYFPADSLFWNRMDTYWREWGESILWEAGTGASQLSFNEAHLLLSAHKSAALKICPTGLALLAKQPELISPFEQAIDLMHAVMQLLDDLTDWQEDFNCKRYNSFLSWLAADQSMHIDQIYFAEEIAVAMVGGGVLQRYAGLIREYAVKAETVINSLQIDPWSQLVNGLAEHASWLAGKYEHLKESFLVEEAFTRSME